MALRAPRGAPAFNASFGLPSRPSLLGARALSLRASSGARGTTMTAFRKYHGIGNDFVVVDNRAQKNPLYTPDQSVAICDRNTGVGADGVIFLLPPKRRSSDFAMRLYNSDGTEPEMCGNGIRCLAKFADDLKIPTASPGRFVIDTGAGVIIPEIEQGSSEVKVDMGEPVIIPGEVPTTLDTSESAGYEAVLNVDGTDWTFSCVSMGNPHAISFVSKEVFLEMDTKLEEVGPSFECNPVFPQKTNTEWAFQRCRTEFDMLVWERGAGRTMACGTGACAVLVAAVLTGRADKDQPTVIHLPGGDLTIEWVSKTNHIMMTGPAELVFEGHFPKV
ncbi:unnamed protein product [Chondrus crispus]|uniref:diaminopimelate epimerase n=1 Tax=Chondrus crispus TaxID=2769 RepID=R7QGK7_CHOCR|nr:unnamed protein product [Chondrus crispus]CDF36591.1 unnamed protein product [Chondrus crispus]|eukprot:XP_005716410.1 unnamed protein product [Chondrus crispus]